MVPPTPETIREAAAFAQLMDAELAGAVRGG